MSRRPKSSQHRRINSIRPPLGVAIAYATILKEWLAQIQALILEHVLDGWDRNPIHHSGRVPSRVDRTDSEFIAKKLGIIQVALEERLNPSHLTPEIQKFAARVQTKNGEEFRRTIGISTHDIGVKTLTTGFRDRNVALIKDLALNQINDIRGILENAEINALQIDVLRKQIQDNFKVSESKAELLARDQTLKLNGEITQVRQTNAGITQYMWTTSRDERVRPDHEELEGTIQAWAIKPIVDQKTGRTGHPGEDYQCRCTAFPILEELGERGKEEALSSIQSNLAARPEEG